MNSSGRRLAFVVVVVVLLGCGPVLAQPAIPVDQIPDKIDKEVADQIRKLYSGDARKRYEALGTLMVMGGKAEPSVPFVANMLGDKAVVITLMPLSRHRTYGRLSVAGMARAVLAEWCFRTYSTYWQIEEFADSATKTPPPVHGDMVCQIVESLMSVLKTSHDENAKRQTRYMLEKVEGTISRRSRIKTGPEKFLPGQVQKIQEMMLEGWLAAAQDEDVLVRVWAMRGLVKSKSAKAVDPLIAALKDHSERVRRVAASGLGQLRAERAIEALIESLNDSDSSIGDTAERALTRIGAPAVRQLIATIANAKSPIRERAAGVLSKIVVPVRYPDEIQALLGALKHKDSLLRASAAMALRRRQQSVEPLIATLKDVAPEVRAVAAWSLGHISFEEKKPRVIKLLIDLAGKDKSPRVRAAAV